MATVAAFMFIRFPRGWTFAAALLLIGSWIGLLAYITSGKPDLAKEGITKSATVVESDCERGGRQYSYRFTAAGKDYTKKMIETGRRPCHVENGQAITITYAATDPNVSVRGDKPGSERLQITLFALCFAAGIAWLNSQIHKRPRKP
jgi:hypothetical protein